MEAPKLSRRSPTLIDDLPSCLIIDILSRLPIKTLLIIKLVCRSWFLFFSDPLFVRLHRARSPTVLLCTIKHRKMVQQMAGEDLSFDDTSVTLPDSTFTCDNSCRGLLCLRKGSSIYVCNPILGEYITIPIVNRESIARSVKSVFGFCSRSNQFKVLLIHSPKPKQCPASAYMAEIYTIANGSRQWKRIGIAPPYPYDFPDDSVLNGSIHWEDGQSQQIVYFDFESEQFGSLPAPPGWRDGRWSKFWRVRLGVLDGCLFIYAIGYRTGPAIIEMWAMKEYGVEESWTDILSTHAFKFEASYSACLDSRIVYNPSFISLQDVARSEHLTVLSRTRTKD